MWHCWFSENLGQAAALAKQYFKRICKWDGVEDTSSLKLFGHDLVAIEEEVTQIEMFETQGIEGMATWCALEFRQLLFHFREKN